MARENIVLSAEGGRRLVKLLLNPPKPDAALRRAIAARAKHIAVAGG